MEKAKEGLLTRINDAANVSLLRASESLEGLSPFRRVLLAVVIVVVIAAVLRKLGIRSRRFGWLEGSIH